MYQKGSTLPENKPKNLSKESPNQIIIFYNKGRPVYIFEFSFKVPTVSISLKLFYSKDSFSF